MLQKWTHSWQTFSLQTLPSPQGSFTVQSVWNKIENKCILEFCGQWTLFSNTKEWFSKSTELFNNNCDFIVVIHCMYYLRAILTFTAFSTAMFLFSSVAVVNLTIRSAVFSTTYKFGRWFWGLHTLQAWSWTRFGGCTVNFKH